MAAPLIAGLGRALASQGARQVAVQGAKKIAKDKITSIAKDKVKEKLSGRRREEGQDKKLSKKSQIISSSGDSEVNVIQRRTFEDTDYSADSRSTSDRSSIQSASTSLSPVNQLKMNVKNIHKFLLNRNKKNAKLQSEDKRILRTQVSRDKLALRERKLEASPFGKSLKNIKDSVPSPNEDGNILDKLLEFIGVIILGVIVNGLPAIVEKVQEIIDNIVNFLTPIQSGFNLIKAFFTGELDQVKYNADRKRVDGALESFEADGGLIDQMAEKLGPLGDIVKQLKPLTKMLRTQVRGKDVVLAKKGGKEGFLDKKTGEFTEREWTSEERETMYGTRGSGDSGAPGDTEGGGGDVEGAGSTDANNVSGYPITSHYGRRWGRLHGGIDIGTPTGTALALSHSGEVIYSALHDGYGNMIDAWVPALNVQFRFAHLTKRYKKTGEKFKANEVLGLTGGGAGDPGRGSSTGPHLHYEIDTARGGAGYGGARDKALLYRMAKNIKLGNILPSTGDGEGGGIDIIKGNMPTNEKVAQIQQISHPDPTENVSTYYYVQPYETIQNQIVTFPIPVSNKSMSRGRNELNPLWEM